MPEFAAPASGVSPGEDAVVDLIPLIRRVIAARARDFQVVEDLVQETVARVMAARDRVESGALAPYAVATARNLVSSFGRGRDRDRQKAHLLVDGTADPPPEDGLIQREETTIVGAALARLSPEERAMLLAHEVHGTGTAELAASRGSTPGAVAAQLNRTRAKLRVEYLLADACGCAAHRSVPAGAVRVVQRRPAAATRTRLGRSSFGVRQLSGVEYGAVRTASPAGEDR